jgi:hypothetical protein
MLRHQQQYSFFDAETVTRAIRFVNLADEVRTATWRWFWSRIVKEVEESSPGWSWWIFPLRVPPQP